MDAVWLIAARDPGGRDIGLERYDGFIYFFCRLHQAPAVADTFQVQSDHRSPRVRAEIFQNISLVDIEFVSDTGELGHSHIFVVHYIPEHQAQPAALCNKRKTSLAHFPMRNKRKANSAVSVRHGQSIGSHEAYTILRSDSGDTAGQVFAVFPRFVESAGKDGYPFNPFPSAILHGRRNKTRRDQHDRQFRHHGKIFQTVMDAYPLHLFTGMSGCDTEYGALISPAKGIFQNVCGDIDIFRGKTENDHGLGIKK